MEYSKLKPGLYLQTGQNIKALSLTSAAGWDDFLNARSPGVETLAAQVSWVFIATHRRRSYMRQIPYTWQLNGNDVEEWEDVPFTFGRATDRQEFQRIDTAMQLYGFAAYEKMRGQGRRAGNVAALAWLDPAMLEPDPRTGDRLQGYTQYFYNTSTNRRTIPGEDVLFINNYGMREIAPSPSAASATSLAAQILHDMGNAGRNFFDSNALPAMLVYVPPGTSELERTRLGDAFRRIFSSQQPKDGNKTIGVSQDVKIEKLSFEPDKWLLSDISDGYREEILSAHDVPPELVYRTANRAEKEEAVQTIVSAMGGRLEDISVAFNMDEDMKRLGLRLTVQTEQHKAFDRDMASLSTAAVNFAQIFTPEATAHLLGIAEDEFPPGMEIFATAPPAAQPMADDVDEMREEEIRKLRRFIKAGKHEKRSFKSDILTDDEIAEVVAGQDAPFHSQEYP